MHPSIFYYFRQTTQWNFTKNQGHVDFENIYNTSLKRIFQEISVVKILCKTKWNA
jgi:hypothetical protein